MKVLIAKLHVVCVKEKEHALLGGAYAASAVWHHSAILTVAYGIVAFTGIHLIRRKRDVEKKDTQRIVYHGRHLAD